MVLGGWMDKLAGGSVIALVSLEPTYRNAPRPNILSQIKEDLFVYNFFFLLIDKHHRKVKREDVYRLKR